MDSNTIQNLINNIDGPIEMLERKKRMGRILNSAPTTSIFPMLRPREFEDSLNISEADRERLESKHNDPSPQPQMRLNPQALEFHAQATTNWGQQWNTANWVAQQPDMHQYENAEWEHDSLNMASQADSYQFSENQQTPVAEYNAANGYDVGHASYYAPVSEEHLQQQQESQLYGLYQTYNQGYAVDPYSGANGHYTTPTQSAQETFSADFYGLPFTVEAFFPMAPEEEHFAADFAHENFPTLPAGLSESISEACLWSVIFGSYEEDDSSVTEEEMHGMRFVARDQVFDPVDESLRFGELSFSMNGTTLNTAPSNQNVETSQDKPTEETAANKEDNNLSESDLTPESTPKATRTPTPQPQPKPEPVRTTEHNAQVGGTVSLNSIFGIAGPGYHADGNTREEHAAPTTTPTATNAQRGRRSWASVARERKASAVGRGGKEGDGGDDCMTL